MDSMVSYGRAVLQTNEDIFREFQKKGAVMGYDVKLIANESTRKQAKEYDQGIMGKQEFRFLPDYAPVGLIIWGG